MKGPLKSKAKAFASRIVKLGRYLREKKRETVISHQITKSGTSIAANVYEAEYAESAVDFIHKLKISRKEMSETMLWLELLHENDYIDSKL